MNFHSYRQKQETEWAEQFWKAMNRTTLSVLVMTVFMWLSLPEPRPNWPVYVGVGAIAVLQLFTLVVDLGWITPQSRRRLKDWTNDLEQARKQDKT
jgi:bacteriorhodopsin